MKISAEIVCDSLSPAGIRLTTFVLTFPRFILPEFNTHRMFSRNASSSRAIPVTKQIQLVKDYPFIPIAFNKNAPGMQGGELVNAEQQNAAEHEWLIARDAAVTSAERLVAQGISKQYANRLLEPFSWTTVVCTATEYANFFALRYHEAAQPEICELAKQMWELYSNKEPTKLAEGDWHLPFIPQDRGVEPIATLIKRSVAKCARVSYKNHDGTETTTEQDLALYERLVGGHPIHASPAEHQAQARSESSLKSGNFNGWIQYRQVLKNQNITTFNR
jgi:thymidylate synthase ThyX